jgi:hypothetical protein
MDPYTLSKSRWGARRNILKGKNHRGLNCGCYCCREDRFDRHHVRPRIAWELRNEYRLPRGRQALWKTSPSALLDWFWDSPWDEEEEEELGESQMEVEEGPFDGDWENGGSGWG